MKVRYENLSDVLIVHLQQGKPIAEVREDGLGSRFSFDKDGHLVAMELVDASRRPDLMRFFEGRLEQAFGDGVRRRRMEDVGDEGGSIP